MNASPAAETPIALDGVIETAEFRAGLRRFLHESERIAVAHELTTQRYLLLLMIKGSPDGRERSTVTELADRLLLAQHTVTELVARAEKAGLVARERSPDDGRVHHLRLTPEGDRRLMGAFRGIQTERDALRRTLSWPPAS
jgi:DNA-binding MarR family transcriptional regulator